MDLSSIIADAWSNRHPRPLKRSRNHLPFAGQERFRATVQQIEGFHGHAMINSPARSCCTAH